MNNKSELEIPPSLMESVINPIHEKFSMTCRLFISIFTAEINDTSIVYQKIYSYLYGNVAERKLSGLVLQRDNIIVLFLESDNIFLNEVLCWIDQEDFKIESQISTCLLAFNEEYPQRVFEHFSSDRVISNVNMRNEFEKSEEETEKLIWEAYSKFLLAGKTIGSRLREESKFTAPLLKEALNYIQFTPDEFRILFNHHFPSIKEYLEIMNRILEVELDTNDSWPNEPYISELTNYSIQPFDNYNGYTLV